MVDVITTTIDRKLEALRCHVSQVGEWDVETFMRARLRTLGEAHGYEYAESFQVIRRLR